MQVDFVLLFDDSTIISILMLQEQFWSTKAEMIILLTIFSSDWKNIILCAGASEVGISSFMARD